MKQWRSKYGRVPESRILQAITEDGTIDTCIYFLADGFLYPVYDGKIYMQMFDDDNLYYSIIQYMKLKKINIFDSLEELEKHLEAKQK